MSDSPDPSPSLDLPAILARADRLAEARAKATAGLWEIREDDDEIEIRRSSDDRVSYQLIAKADIFDDDEDEPEAVANFELFLLARNFATEEDVRALAVEVERLRTANQFLRDEIIKLSKQATQDRTW